MGTSHLLVCDGNKHKLLDAAGETLPEGELRPDQFPRPAVYQPVASTNIYKLVTMQRLPAVYLGSKQI